MTDKQQLHGQDEATTPEEQAIDAAFEKKRAESRQHLKEREAAGWKWKDKDLVSPDDPEIFVGYDPYTADIFLSPKHAEQLAAQIKESQTQQEGHTR